MSISQKLIKFIFEKTPLLSLITKFKKFLAERGGVLSVFVQVFLRTLYCFLLTWSCCLLHSFHIS